MPLLIKSGKSASISGFKIVSDGQLVARTKYKTEDAKFHFSVLCEIPQT